MAKYVSMLTLDECVQVFDYWIQDKLKASTQLKLKKVGVDKARADFKIGSTHCTATININYNELGYCDAVMMAYHKGHAEPVHIKKAIENFGGTSRDSNAWIQLSYERWLALQDRSQQKTNTAENKSALKETEVKAEEMRIANEKAAAKRQIEIERNEYLANLPGAAVAQYIYKAAKSLQDPIYHQNQVTKTPDQHKYNIKKGFTDPKDFHIMANHLPTTAQIIKFIESPEKFDMPQNPYGFTAKDIVEAIKNPPAPLDPNLPAPRLFDPKNYISAKDLSLGTGVMPSMDLNGVITNIQKYLVEPLPNGTDKIFGTEAIVRGSYYIFDHEQKLKPEYKPRNIIITEGWATGKTINGIFNTEKNNDSLVVVPWNAGQVKHAVKNCAEQYPDANIIIATDNDVKSFYYANESEERNLKLVKNTGLQVAIEACHIYPELSSRLSVIMPHINHEQIKGNAYPSDFNDIESMYGYERFKQNIFEEVKAAGLRRTKGIEEIPRLVDTYNAQVKYFSEHHAIGLHMIQPTGELNTEPHQPESLIKKQAEIALKAEMAEDDLINKMAKKPMAGFFNVPVNDDIKTDFDKKMEQSARFLGGAYKSNEPSPTNVVANTLAPTVDAPAEQPIIDPITFTAILYESHLFNSFNKIQELGNKQEMLEALEAKPMSMDAANKVMQAMFDTTINPHLPKMIGSVMDDYKDQPFYADLAEIKAIMDDNFIQINNESQQLMKDMQRTIVNNFVCNNQHKGLDDEVANKLVSSEISAQPIESKRTLYTEIRDTMKSLGAADQEWLGQLKEAMLESKQTASTISKERALSTENDYSPAL